ncbi:MAG: hypothetical protein WAK97_03440, partial [Pseudolabrys sp.]
MAPALQPISHVDIDQHYRRAGVVVLDCHDGFDLSALARAIEHATEIHGGRNRGHARVAGGIC